MKQTRKSESALKNVITRLNAELAEKNHELKIETTLERVRAVAMAMRKPDELAGIGETLFTELKALDFKDLRNTEIIINNDIKETVTSYYYSDYGITGIIEMDYKTNETVKSWADQMRKADNAYAKIVIAKNEMDSWRKYRESIGYLPDPKLNDAKEVYYYSYSIGLGGLSISTFKPSTDEQIKILERFRNVFNLSYQRYIDIAKAEGQAREATIEAALERTRTQSMIMQHSNELDYTLRVFHEQVQLLGINSAFSFLWLPDEEKEKHIFWAIWEESKDGSTVFKNKAINYPLDRNEPATKQCLVDWKSDEPIHSYAVVPEGVENYFATWAALFEGAEKLKPEHFQDGLYYVEAFMKYGCFGVMVETNLADDKRKILGRFAIEFERTYTRFMDLKKAEAQTREAEIELALERVRARTMAMQKSEELKDVAHELRVQLAALGTVELETCAVNLYEESDDFLEAWAAVRPPDSTKEIVELHYSIPKKGIYVIEDMLQAYHSGVDEYLFKLEGSKGSQWMSTMEVQMPDMFAAAAAAPDFKQTGSVEAWFCCHYFSGGALIMITMTPPLNESRALLKRFTQVFGLAYRRFADLKNAEAHTREAKIEAALERVRARALAMQQPEELKAVAEVLRQEMGLLGVEELETSSIYLHDEHTQKAECWYALKDIHQKEKVLVTDNFSLDLNDTWVGRQMFDFYESPEKQTSIVMKGPQRKEWISYCEKLSVPLQGYYGEVIPDRTYHLYKFSHGYIGAASASDISTESWGLLKRAASVFSLAYSRFRDLSQARIDLKRLKEEKKRAEDALTELKATQTQLIQSEKMASLGELTAGIAHEIQNPLNFVNNFSEVNAELLAELLEEAGKGNLQEVKDLVSDIRDNEQKINHHGKRADAIVKGMLQHSRASNDQKELTDINSLADEYLRLAYHGLRAKDKSFNATLNTIFDPSIGKIQVIPQDIGRVLLNLYNNAFYAVHERSKLKEVNYEPTVEVITNLVDNKIQIQVKDNGTGISEKLKDKIFQPFFTTKPTGQGTGLGLSLSYDIVKAHGGEIQLNTVEGNGTTFIVELPSENNNK